MNSHHLPAVVLGLETPIGLTIVRELGSRGVPVHGIARSSNAVGLYSRYLLRSYLRAESETSLIAQLVDLGEMLKQACLIAISENDIAMLNRHRHLLGHFILLYPDERRMALVLDKEKTYSIAREIGLAVPRTVQIESLAQLDERCAKLAFPVVVKWANPNEVIGRLSAASLKLDKAFFCYSFEELRLYLKPYATLGVFPLIQEYCPGYGLGQFLLMKNGECVFAFQHRRIHEWPPEGGFSSLCESVPIEGHATLLEKSVSLLRNIDWEGIAMVEYRFDPETKEAMLMEINGRFWGSLPLARLAGAPFPWLLYKLYVLGEPIETKGYESHVQCRFMIPETKRLFRILFQPGKIKDKNVKFNRLKELVVFLGAFVRPRTGYFVFEWNDPAPFLHDLFGAVQKLISRTKRNARIGAIFAKREQ